MICDLCKKRQATVHVTEIINNEMTELHLCEDCAKKKSFQMEQHFGLADLLAGLSDLDVPLEETKQRKLKCSNCGLNYEDFKKIGRLGCGECYNTFRQNLVPLLKRIHRATKHVGSVPLKKEIKHKEEEKKVEVHETKESKIEMLKRQMQEAVEEEAFEKAARIRDKINELKKNNEDSKEG